MFSKSVPDTFFRAFGEPIQVDGMRKDKGDIPNLTRTLETAVQQRLDGIRLSENYNAHIANSA